MTPYTVAREYLAGASPEALRAYLSQTGGRLLPPASPESVNLFRMDVSGLNDARVLGGAYAGGAQLITRDAEILGKTAGIAIRS